MPLLHAQARFVDARPVDYLFHPVPLPSTSLVVVNPSLAGAPFKRYKAGLHRQLRGRTPLLDDVLNILEESSRRLEEDLGALHASDPEGGCAVLVDLGQCNPDTVTASVLVERLREAYQPEAANLCSRISSIVQPNEDNVSDLGELHAVFSGGHSNSMPFRQYDENIGLLESTPI